MDIKFCFLDYDGSVQIDVDRLIISLWDEYLEYEGRGENKIFVNNKEFFEKNFENSYDTAWAVSLSKTWRHTDDFVFFDDEGYISSFSHWNDENSPINIDKIDISPLIDGLKKFRKEE